MGTWKDFLAYGSWYDPSQDRTWKGRHEAPSNLRRCASSLRQKEEDGRSLCIEGSQVEAWPQILFLDDCHMTSAGNIKMLLRLLRLSAWSNQKPTTRRRYPSTKSKTRSRKILRSSRGLPIIKKLLKVMVTHKHDNFK